MPSRMTTALSLILRTKPGRPGTRTCAQKPKEGLVTGVAATVYTAVGKRAQGPSGSAAHEPAVCTWLEVGVLVTDVHRELMVSNKVVPHTMGLFTYGDPLCWTQLSLQAAAQDEANTACRVASGPVPPVSQMEPVSNRPGAATASTPSVAMHTVQGGTLVVKLFARFCKTVEPSLGTACTCTMVVENIVKGARLTVLYNSHGLVFLPGRLSGGRVPAAYIYTEKYGRHQVKSRHGTFNQSMERSSSYTHSTVAAHP